MYMVAFYSSARRSAIVRAISSALGAEVPSGRLWDQITSERLTTAAPACLLPSWRKLLPSVNQVTSECSKG